MDNNVNDNVINDNINVSYHFIGVSKTKCFLYFSFKLFPKITFEEGTCRDFLADHAGELSIKTC